MACIGLWLTYVVVAMVADLLLDQAARSLRSLRASARQSSAPTVLQQPSQQPICELPLAVVVPTALKKVLPEALPGDECASITIAADDELLPSGWRIAAVHDGPFMVLSPLHDLLRVLPACLLPSPHLSLVVATRLQVTLVERVQLLLLPETWVHTEMDFSKDGICVMVIEETVVRARLMPVTTLVVEVVLV